MKINELLMAIHRDNFDMEKELQVKKYLPIEEKKLIAKGIIYECTEQVDGVIKVDSVQQYLSYIKYMILRHTNLEYTPEDYDKLCSPECGYNTLLNAIMLCFEDDAKECLRILNLMMDDCKRETSIEFTVAKFLNNMTNILEQWSEKLGQKVDSMNIQDLLPKDLDLNQLADFLNNNYK